MGALDGGSPMSLVEFKKWQCPLSSFVHLRNGNVPCRHLCMSRVDLYSLMSHVEFKK